MGAVKIDAVVQRGVNDHHVLDLARHFKGTGHGLRFIEFMDVGATNKWHLEDVLSGAEIVRRVTAELPADPIEPAYRGEVAKRWRYADGDGEFGVITSVTIGSPVCSRASARISSPSTPNP